MTYESFLVKFAEFNSAPSAIVARAIADATLSVAADVWGDNAEEGIAFLAAHKLASGPGGYGLRTESKASGYQRTIYGAQYETLAKNASAMAPRVVGGFSTPYNTPIG